MTQQVRKLGIDVIREAAWGTHLCQFYHAKEDLVDILVPYFKTGLENNEFCMWVTSEPLSAGDAKISLSKVVKDLDDYVRKGQIEILDYDQWYTKSGEFDPHEVLQGWLKKENQALKRGFDGLRLTGNTFWLEQERWRNFTDYEAMVDNVIGKYRMIAICSYCLDKCGASEVIDVVANHQFALIRRSGKWELIQSAERKRAQEALVGLTHSLRKRVEELNCLYGISRLRENRGLSLEEILKGTVALIPPAWQHSEIACARIVLEGREFTTDNFRETAWKQVSDIIVHSERIGVVEVFYLEEKQQSDEGPFMKEERRLIDSIAERLGRITERKRAEEMLQKAHHELELRVEERTSELRRLSSRLFTIQEDERKRISLELHDSIGQFVAALHFGVKDALDQIREGATEASVKTLKALVPMIQQTSEEVRRIHADLRPSLLDDLGILVTISWFCRRCRKLYSSLRIEEDLDIEEKEVPEPLKIVMFRVLQEAINNVAKHGKADLVRVSLKGTGSTIELVIQDNGRGFDVEHVRSAQPSMGSVGLASMRERTELSGGSFSIDSIKGGGTTVRASWQR
jgi:signal transduction histidine kinase